MSGLFAGKRALIIGVAGERSIAHAIASSLHKQGAELAFNYFPDERLKKRVTEIAQSLGSNLVFPCDVAHDEQIIDFFSNLSQTWDSFDVLIHSVAFAPKEQLEGDYVDNTTRTGFNIAHDISSYSFLALAKHAYPMMQERKGSMLTLSYLGAERVIPNYNVMGLAKASLEANVRYMANSLGPKGIRVNAISAGPIRTLAASGISGFTKILNYYENQAPLRRNVSLQEVGNSAVFLCSEWASGITGEVLHVDAGMHSIAFGEVN